MKGLSPGDKEMDAGERLGYRAGATPPRERARKALFKDEEFNPNLLNNSPNPIVVIAPDTSVKYVNPPFERVTGFSAAEVIGRKPPYPWWIEESVEQGIRSLEEGMYTGARRIERVFQNKEGRRFWVELHSNPVASNGKLKYYLATWIDISERKRAEEALKESEHRYRTVFEQSRDAIYIINREDRFVDVNQSMLELFGYTRQEMIGLDVHKVYVDPADREGLRETIEHGGSLEDYELRLHKKDGTEMDCLVTTAVQRASDGSFVGYQGTIRDITERKRAETALRESEEFSFSLLNNSPTPVVVLNPDTSIRYINPAFEKLTGFSYPEIVGRPAPYPFWLEGSMEESMRVLREGMEKGAWRFERLFKSKDGRRFWVEITSTPVTERGKLKYYVATWVDITERKQAEEALRESEYRYRTLFEQSRDDIYISSRDGIFIDVNQSMLELFGYSRQEMVGLDVHDIYVYPAEREKFRQEIEQKESVRDYEAKFRRKDGTEMDCLLTATLRRAADRSILGYQGIIRDITEHKRSEIQIIQSAKMASLGLMAGGIAHELRNPLSIISASAQLLIEHDDNLELRAACAQKIYVATKRASSIIEGLLRFARPTGELMQELDLQAILEETLSLLGQQLLSNKVALRKRFQPELPHIYGNSNLLQQVFINLVLNACNAMPEGGMLTLSTRANGGGQVELQVGDTGVGIPPEHLHRIFDPFFTTMPVGKGTGLGLSLCYSIIQRHQGAIEVDSQVGQGTTITIRFPIRLSQ